MWAQARPVARAGTTYTRYLHCTAPMLAKNKKKKNSKKEAKDGAKDSASPSAGGTSPGLDWPQIHTKFSTILDRFTKKATEIKLGKTNPHMFDNLDILINNEPHKFNTLAQTSIKGRNLMITVYDPSHHQNIINGILNSKLNLNPQFDPVTNTLKVPLPPITTETKQENIKVLKAQYEQFKNSNTNSLNSVRLEYKQKFKKKMSDEEMGEVKKFENLHKEYLGRLGEVYKVNEKNLAK